MNIKKNSNLKGDLVNKHKINVRLKVDKVFLHHQLKQTNKYKKRIELHPWLFITVTMKNMHSLLPFEGMVNDLFGQCIVYRNAHIKS